MARKKSRSRKSSRLSSIIWTLITVFAGGGVGGYFNPDWPVVGPLIQSLYSRRAELGNDEVAGNGELLKELKNLQQGLNGENRPPGIETPAMSGNISAQLASAQRPADKILVATFNIQVFGESKLSKPDVVSVLAQVVRQFDIVAIQEVRAKSDDILPRFLSAVNADGSQYNYLIGPRIGRSVSTEQYTYVYDTTRIEYDPTSVGTMSDPSDLLHREPFVARFRAKAMPNQQGFSFWMVNIHTDPDEVPQEVAVLADVFRVMQSARQDEDDVILLGDLNASEKELGPLGQIPGIAWVVGGDVMTNTRKNHAYDNILFHRTATSEFTGRWGVIDLESTFGISRDQALKVSDHLPVWAEFQATESPQQGSVAERFSLPRR